MRDGINTAKRGLPSGAVVTEESGPQGHFTADSLGMPRIPRVKLPHPLAGTGQENLHSVAKTIVPLIVEQLKND